MATLSAARMRLATRNLTRNLSCVNSVAHKVARCITLFSLFGGLLAAVPAHAAVDDATRVRAMENATHLNSLLHGVLPERVSHLVERIAKGKVARIAPEQPVWIIEIINGTILYYQGQDGFVGKQASQLVDDAGQRFGLQALDNAKRSRSKWVSLKLGAQDYQAYCRSQYPFVVCSLAQ